MRRASNRRGAAVLASVVLAAVTALTSPGCCGEPPEARLRRAIEDGRVAAMAKSFDRLGRLVSECYSDSDGRDRADLLGLVRGYLTHLDPAHLFYKEQSLRLTAPGRAEVTLLVALASVPLESIADLERISADLGRVELEFEEESGDWKLVRARWSSVSLTDWF